MNDDHILAHRYSSGHRRQLLASSACGCFYCLAIFPPTAIVNWIDMDDDDIGQTAYCPECGIDSVIGSASGYPITTEFLQRMKAHWF